MKPDIQIDQQLLLEEEIIRKAKADPAAFRVLYEKYYKPVFLFLYHRVGDKDITADLTCQVFLKALQKLHQFEFRGFAEAGKIRHELLMIEKVILHFNFKFNSSDLDEASSQYLDDLSAALQENEHLKIKLTGHTDNVGSAKFNQRLSLHRANAIKDRLVLKGVDPDCNFFKPVETRFKGFARHQILTIKKCLLSKVIGSECFHSTDQLSGCLQVLQKVEWRL